MLVSCIVTISRPHSWLGGMPLSVSQSLSTSHYLRNPMTYDCRYGQLRESGNSSGRHDLAKALNSIQVYSS